MGKNKIIIIIAGVFLLLLGVVLVQDARMKALRGERDRYEGNTTTLLEDVHRYKVQDSLSAARVGALELTLKEYKRYRAEDAALIADLKARNRDLTVVSGAQTSTGIDLSTTIRDTLYIRDTGFVAGRVLRCGDAWYDFEGTIDGDTFVGHLESRDSLLLVETVRYGRFLGFLWKTRKVKDRQLDAVSRNPHTTIQDIQFNLIKK